MASASSSLRMLNGPRNGQSETSTMLAFVLLAIAPLVHSRPFQSNGLDASNIPKSPHDASLWAYLGTAVALVLLGGAFAGLTIALMGQDEIYLQVIATSGEGSERKNAKKVLQLLQKGKHWVLVTLLLSNVITNETLPIVLDRSLGGGWPAVLASTILIVIFGEIVPQSICVRYGLPIGAWMAPIVLGLMYLMAPVAWPTAKLLDKILGEDHGQTYKKAGLKTLVRLHKTLGPSADEMLNEDEVTIITAVLDLKAKPIGSIMTPMKDVFTMSADHVLDEPMMDKILSAGYSRIPIYAPDNEKNFVGMLLVKMLITYDPEDALRVRDFALATLPETRPETSCLDIVNFFQEGKSHMVLVSNYPGESRGALGVVTLEDVIEELIGEEIIDESDVFVDVHKAIRRMAPAPRTRVPKGAVVTDTRPTDEIVDGATPGPTDVVRLDSQPPSRRPSGEVPSSPRLANFLMRRRSSGNGSVHKGDERLSLRSSDPEVIQHLKHLGPSNAAHNPKTTRINTVKIKPGIPNTIPEHTSPKTRVIVQSGAPQGGVGEGLLESAGRDASDGVYSLAVGYGTMSSTANQNASQDKTSETASSSSRTLEPEHPKPKRSKSQSTLGSLHSIRSRSDSPAKSARHTSARSGSISENIVDLNGIKKIVLETTSSSDSEDKHLVIQDTDAQQEHKDNTETENGKNEDKKGGKKKRKKRSGKNKKKDSGNGESAPLLGGGDGS